jgi:hypothetical protein
MSNQSTLVFDMSFVFTVRPIRILYLLDTVFWLVVFIFCSSNQNTLFIGHSILIDCVFRCSSNQNTLFIGHSVLIGCFHFLFVKSKTLFIGHSILIGCVFRCSSNQNTLFIGQCSDWLFSFSVRQIIYFIYWTQYSDWLCFSLFIQSEYFIYWKYI